MMSKISQLNKRTVNIEQAVAMETKRLALAKEEWQAWCNQHRLIFLLAPALGFIIGFYQKKIPLSKMIRLIRKNLALFLP